MHLLSSVAVALVLISTALYCQQADIGSEMRQIVADEGKMARRIKDNIMKKIEEQMQAETDYMHKIKSEIESITKEISKFDCINQAKMRCMTSNPPVTEKNTTHAAIYAYTLTIALFISFCTMHLVAAWMIQ